MNSSYQVTHPFRGLLPDQAFERTETAPLIVDVQYLAAHANYGLVARLRDQGLHELYRYYCQQLATIVPNISAPCCGVPPEGGWKSSTP